MTVEEMKEYLELKIALYGNHVGRLEKRLEESPDNVELKAKHMVMEMLLDEVKEIYEVGGF